jgi:hypothetical protein
MRFSELILYEAMYKVRQTLQNPGSDDWINRAREELCRKIQGQMPIGAPFTAEQMIDAWVKYRKSPEGKTELTVKVALAHGEHCFMFGRGKGECSEEIDLDRIVPGVRGGQYTLENCIIMCSFHNRQRGDRSLEDYLLAHCSAQV